MGLVLRSWRTSLAVLLSSALIVGALVFANGSQPTRSVEASTESALLQTITARDIDGDGLPDWQETLYGTDPRLTDSLKLGMTDSQAVAKGLVVPKAIADIPATTGVPQTPDENGLLPEAPAGTLSAAFSQKFYDLFVAAKEARGGGDLSQVDIANIASKAVGAIPAMAEVAPDFKSGTQIKVSGSGEAALRAFAESAGNVFLKNKANAVTDPLTYFTRALQDDDTSALTHLASMAKAAREVAVGLAAIPVPIELANADLMLINAHMRLSGVINDFAHEDTDPMTALVALQRYVGVMEEFGTAFLHMAHVYKVAGVAPQKGTPGWVFVSMIPDAMTRGNVGPPSDPQP